MAQSTSARECTLMNKQHVLLLCNIPDEITKNSELCFIREKFCGVVFPNIESFNSHKHTNAVGRILYLCGDVEFFFENNTNMYSDIRVIGEFSTNCDQIKADDRYCLISAGQVPINVFDVGVMFRDLFDPEKDYFKLISKQHQFQSLTESNKPGTAYRTGIYMTRVEKDKRENHDDDVRFKLLRCSTNLDGPTDNFRETDHQIIDQVNQINRLFFQGGAELNHVLAQIYENSLISDGFNGSKRKEVKARIKCHADKTKDMPKSGLMAFCSFYKDYVDGHFQWEGDGRNPNLKMLKRSVEDDPFDFLYKYKTSALTRLRFKLKRGVSAVMPHLVKQFDIPLYPNSAFFMPLSTNRFYTHEIVPSILPVEQIPTRMGYVVRCSNTDAVYREGQTYIICKSTGDQQPELVKMGEPSAEGIAELKDMYFKENTTTEMIFYDNRFFFSLNKGDYQKPIV